jgi:hypothetical protein
MKPATRTRVLNTLDRLDGRLRRLESGDARLDALDPGKRTVLSTVWDGNLKPRLDRLLPLPQVPEPHHLSVNVIVLFFGSCLGGLIAPISRTTGSVATRPANTQVPVGSIGSDSNDTRSR